MKAPAPEILNTDSAGEAAAVQGKVEICGVNTSRLKVLKNEETMELLRRTKQGDMAAREELIAGNLRLVLSVLQTISNRGENLDDLVILENYIPRGMIANQSKLQGGDSDGNADHADQGAAGAGG